MRYISVLLIVVFHSTSAYVGASYIVMDPNTSPVTKIIGAVLVSVLINMLFFVAGFFAIPSYESKGLLRFIVSKLKRLGIPLVICCVFIGPMLPYIGYWSQDFNGLETTGYWNFWVNYMKSFGHPGMTGGRLTADPKFYYQHFWFLSSLLVLFVLFAPLYEIWKRVSGFFSFRLMKTEALSNKSVTLILLLFPLLVSAGYESGVFVFLGKFLRWRYIRTPMISQAAYFSLGIYAYSKKWFINGKAPGPLVFWIIACILCLLGNQTVLRELAFLPKIHVLTWFSMRYLNLAFLALLSTLTFLFMNRPSSINEKFAASSYSIFIIHFPIVASLQFIMLDWGIPIVVKFIICVVVPIALSFVISNYIIRSYPRLSAAGLVGLFVLMSLFLHPGRSAGINKQTSGSVSAVDSQQIVKPQSRNRGEIIDSQLDFFDRKLDLSDEQKEKLRAVIESRMEANEQFISRFEAVLTEKQLKKYREIMRR